MRIREVQLLKYLGRSLQSPAKESTLQMNPNTPRPKFTVTADGTGVVSHVGASLLAEMAEMTGLATALSEAIGPDEATSLQT